MRPEGERGNAAGDAMRDPLVRLVELTRASLEAASSNDAGTLAELDARRRDLIAALPLGLAADPLRAELVREASALDAELIARAVQARNALGSKAREANASERARRGYALTGALRSDAPRA